MLARCPETKSELSREAQDTYKDIVQRVSQREIKRSHRVHPILVESILLAKILHDEGKAQNFILSSHSLIETCSFAQRIKWLCPWGAQFYDETHRPENREIPAVALEKRLALEFDERWLYELSQEEISTHLADASQQWERVYLDLQDNLECLKHLHKHPCEELHIFCPDGIREEDAQNIALCRTLRVLSAEVRQMPANLYEELAKLPNLEIIHDVDRSIDPLAMAEIQRPFPFLHSLRFGTLHGPITAEEASTMVEMIKSRNATLRHIFLKMCPPAEVMIALAQCPRLVTLHICGDLEVDENFRDQFTLFLSSKHVQKTLQNIVIEQVDLEGDILNLLALCCDIRSFSYMNSSITDEQLSKIILANYRKIRHISMQGCHEVGENILDALEKCVHLERVDMRWSAIPEAIDEYKKHRRRNYQAIWNHRMHERVHEVSDEDEIHSS